MPGGIGSQIEWDETDGKGKGGKQRLAIYYNRPGAIQGATQGTTVLESWGADKMIELWQALNGVWHHVPDVVPFF